MLQSARESQKITQLEMSKATDMSKNQISAIECGQSKASVDLLLGYCKKLGMTPNDLLGFQDREILPELKDVILKLNPDNQYKILRVIKALEL